MKTPALHFLWICLAFLALNCSKFEEENIAATGPVTLDDFKEGLASQPITGSIWIDGGRDVVRTASMELQVRSFDSAERLISDIAIRSYGYIADVFRREDEGTNGEKATAGRIVLRIPASHFDYALGQVRALGSVRSERVISEDVTDQLVDLDARLKTQSQLEDRLLNLLNMKGGALKEIIEIEEKLASVRENIEGIQGQSRSLKDRVLLATLLISLSEPGVRDSTAIDNSEPLEDAVNAGLDIVGGLAAGGVHWLIVLLPVASLIFLLYRISRPLVRQISRRNRQTDPGKLD